ncbi:FAD-binding oxidoreductase [Actinoplanes solisilvae]|uniref:FAD-binding oxidoreductase n=1 Tax=Actinoplanes solisilvae TaxID=2486853 RepID=UPI000FDB7C01|nr:FAD-binding oxidoreductase [Actinoplanes solisilvae]
MGALDELTRPAGDDDHVGGVPARLVASPASTEEAAAVVAASKGLAVVVRGGGTKIHWGVQPRALDLIIDTRRLAGMVEHAAGDLITVLKAGTSLGDLKLGDQQLAIDAPAGATVGGTVATGASGPRRLHYGTARDLLIGITVVRPDGKVAKSGGKVVKNVAGYDLGKIYTGSYGTLGLITECVFRLHPRPGASAYVRSTAPVQAVPAILAARVAPTAIEVDTATGELAVLLEGTPEGVRERSALVGKLLAGEVSEKAPRWWARYPWAGDEIGMKLSVPLSKVPALISSGSAVRGSAATGVLYAAARDITEVERLRAHCVRSGGHAVVLTAPSSIRDILDMWGPVPGLALMRQIKDRFDPEHRFAPGRFVGGI